MSSSSWVRHRSNKSDAYTPVADKSTSNKGNAALQPRGEARQRQEIFEISEIETSVWLVGDLRIPNIYRWVFTFSLSIPTTLTAYTIFTYYIHGQVLVNNYGNVSALPCLNVKPLDIKHHPMLMYISVVILPGTPPSPAASVTPTASSVVSLYGSQGYPHLENQQLQLPLSSIFFTWA